MNGLGAIIRRIDAATATPSRLWYVEIVQQGLDLNGRYRSAEMLKTRASLFEGRPLAVYERVDAHGRVYDHQQNRNVHGKEVLNTFGHLRDVRYDPSAFDGAGGLVGAAVLEEGTKLGDEMQQKLVANEANGGLAHKPFRLSFTGYGRVDASGRETIESVLSVDVVTHPAANGVIGHRLAASNGGGTMNRIQKIIAAIKAKCAELVAGIPDAAATEYALARHVASKVKGNAALAASVATAFALPTTHKLAASEGTDVLDEAMNLVACVAVDVDKAIEKEKGTGGGGTPMPSPSGAAPTGASVQDQERLTASLRNLDIRESKMRLREACERAHLPAFAVTRLLASHEGQILDEAAAERIAKEKATEIDEVHASRTMTHAVVVEEKQERLTASLTCFLSERAQKPKGLDPIRDFGGSLNRFLEREFGIDVRDCRLGVGARRRLAAAVDATNFDAIFNDSLNRAMLAEYRGDEAFVLPWRAIAHVVPETDFRTKEVLAATYYNELPDVAEGAPYTYATTPTDRKESYALSKRGIIETITWEKMLNDDLGVWQSMLRRLALAARETLNERVFQKIRRATQPTMQDGFKLTSASRTGDVNEGTANLTGDATGWGNFVTAVSTMMGLKGGGGKAKGVRPKNLIIPLAKAQVAGSLFADFSPAATDIPTRRGLEILKAQIPNVIVDLGTGDANDWFLMADPMDAEVIRVAFLGGREEPEVYIANGDTFGSMFTNDRIEAKMRHPYAVAAVDYVGIMGENASA